MNEPLRDPKVTVPRSPLHHPLPHESATLHTTGAARYVDDLPSPRGMLVAEVFVSPEARARIARIDVTRAREQERVHAVLLASDIPGVNDIAPFTHDEELLASHRVHCVGQAIALVVAEDLEACRRARRAIELELDVGKPIVGLDEALALGSHLSEPHVMARGDVEAALSSAAIRFDGEVRTPGQDHFYLETHVALAIPLESGAMHVCSSSQHPTEVQAKVAEVLGIARASVVVEVPRMGGGFGGKETQGAHFAALAALGARRTGRPVKLWLNRDQDMTQTGKRHPFLARYRAGFDTDGRILALAVDLFSDGGFSLDLSQAILDRALFHLDNAYSIPALRFSGRVMRTNTVSNTAFRGFGGPQGMMVIERIMNEAAARLELDPAEVRRRNYYREAPRDLTPYDQVVLAPRIARITDELLLSARYSERRMAIDRANATTRFRKRGIALAPVKFGISFTNSILNQAGAFLLVYVDGTVQLNHGGTEMGQGLHTKMRAIAAHELGVELGAIRMMSTATDKVPNTSATAASSGADLNGQAVKEAAATIRERLRPVAARLLDVLEAPNELVFSGGRVSHPKLPRSIAFAEVTAAAYVAQVPMFATGFYRTPGIHYDRALGQGKPFHYFAYGAAVIEVEVDGLTGEHRVIAIDVLHDVGDSLVPSIDRGQIEGGLIQGLGWLTREELVWSSNGRLKTHSPDTYKVPAYSDPPLHFRVALLEDAAQSDVIHGSKAVGEPPLMLALGVVTALEHAIAAFGAKPSSGVLQLPATPEAVLRAIDLVRAPR
ncbi:MAG: xanthine dehydrogenase molybdopterin binding subunit [Deltaproteobacteria bacterium]|nr:xanthine dehydrogenase molybdopterin binding subunit [Deltaproteobacteria bacterium]